MKSQVRLSHSVQSLNFIFFLLAVAGLFISGYVLQSFMREAPAMCVGAGCDLVRASPHSRLLGVPVPGFGFLGYFALAVLGFLRLKKGNNSFAKLILAITAAGAMFVTWFTYVQLAIIYGVCVWCLLSGLSMYLLFFLSLMLVTGKEVGS